MGSVVHAMLIHSTNSAVHCYVVMITPSAAGVFDLAQKFFEGLSC